MLLMTMFRMFKILVPQHYDRTSSDVQIWLVIFFIKTQSVCLAAVKHHHASCTHMWVVLHDQQVLYAPLWAGPLISSHEPGNVVVLQQRQPVDGAFI